MDEVQIDAYLINNKKQHQHPDIKKQLNLRDY